MKKVFTLALLSLGMMMSCTKESDEQPAQAQKQEFPKFYASMESADSRTFVDENYKLYWTADDRITIFEGNTYPLQYRFMGETGANQGEFDVVTPAGYYTGSGISANYAVYPYNENTTIEYNGTITYTVPATQQYAVNSFGLGANPMVAVTNGVDDKFLAFKNLGGCFEFPLYGNNVKVKSIVFRGKNNEKLAGVATITAAYGEEPTLAFGGSATEEITLDCGEEGVLLSNDAENPTKFWIAVPATTFEDGFTITITDTNNIVTEKSVGTSITIGRGKVQPFENALQLTTIQNNEIWYTSSSGKITFNKLSAITGDNIDSGNITNNYANGIGIINFGENAVVTTIGTEAFSNLNNLTRVILPNSITSIGEQAFSYCESLQNINIPDGVTSIGVSAFSCCPSLQSITIPENVESIGTNAFNGCSVLKTATILSNKITSIGDYTFKGCRELTSFDIPNSVQSIGDSAFRDCVKLTGVIIPESVTSIAASAFRGCSALTNITIPNGVTRIEEFTFYCCVELISVTIHNSILYIGEHAFDYCQKLTSVTLSENLETIGSWAFVDCDALESITLPASVTTIGNEAFNSCSSLKVVYCKPITPPALGSNVFSGNASGRKIYVPIEPSIVGDYENATNWSSYAADIEGYEF